MRSPILQKYTKQNFEVLVLHDPIDEFVMQHLNEYENRKVKSISKDDVSVLNSDEIAKKKLQKLKEMYKPLTDWFKEHLGKKVEKVSISNKLVDAPLFIFTSQYGYSAQMEKINKAQAFSNQENTPSYMLAKKSLELNPGHPVMKKLLNELKENDNVLSEASTEYADLLFQMAILNSGFLVENPMDMTEPLEKLIKVGFGLERDDPVEEIEVELDDEEEDIDEGEGDEAADEALAEDAIEELAVSDADEVDLSELDEKAEQEEHEVMGDEL